MTFQGLDGTKLLLLMLLGGAFAFAGIYLLFRPPSKDGETRIELLGMKFNASSGGLLVFIVGALFVAAPIFVPERPKPSVTKIAGTAAATLMPNAASGQQVTGITVEAVEVEANDTVASANRIVLGSAINGELSKGDVDYYAVDIPEDKTGDIVANVVVSAGDVALALFDDAGEALRSDYTFGIDRMATVSTPIERPGYYVLASNRDKAVSIYQLTIAVRPE